MDVCAVHLGRKVCVCVCVCVRERERERQRERQRERENVIKGPCTSEFEAALLAVSIVRAFPKS